MKVFKKVKKIFNPKNLKHVGKALVYINLGLIGSLTVMALSKVTKLWQAIIGWVKAEISKVKKHIEGFKYFISCSLNKFSQILRQYWVEDEQWFKTEAISPINENEVPPEILHNYQKKKAKSEVEYDATPELNAQLQLCT